MRVFENTYSSPFPVKIEGILAFANDEGELDDALDIVIVGIPANERPLRCVKKLVDVIVFYSETETEYIPEFDFAKSFRLDKAVAKGADSIFIDSPSRVPLYWATKYESLIKKIKEQK